MTPDGSAQVMRPGDEDASHPRDGGTGSLPELPCPAHLLLGDTREPWRATASAGGLVCGRCGRIVQAATYRPALVVPDGNLDAELVCDDCLALAEPGRLESCPPPQFPLVCTLCGRAPWPGVPEVWHVRPDLGKAWCPCCLAGAPQPELNRKDAKDAKDA